MRMRVEREDSVKTGKGLWGVLKEIVFLSEFSLSFISIRIDHFTTREPGLKMKMKLHLLWTKYTLALRPRGVDQPSKLIWGWEACIWRSYIPPGLDTGGGREAWSRLMRELLGWRSRLRQSVSWWRWCRGGGGLRVLQEWRLDDRRERELLNLTLMTDWWKRKRMADCDWLNYENEGGARG